jgi:hypothetical protein
VVPFRNEDRACMAWVESLSWVLGRTGLGRTGLGGRGLVATWLRIAQCSGVSPNEFSQFTSTPLPSTRFSMVLMSPATCEIFNFCSSLGGKLRGKKRQKHASSPNKWVPAATTLLRSGQLCAQHKKLAVFLPWREWERERARFLTLVCRIVERCAW